MSGEILRLEAVEQSLAQSGDTSLDRARMLIAAAKYQLTILEQPSDLKRIRDVVHTVLEYFKLRSASLIACNELARERIIIEYEIGKLLLNDDEIHRGGKAEGEDGRRTLESKYGISRWAAQRYRKTASIDPEDLEQIFSDISDRESEITSAQVSAYITEMFGADDERNKLHWSVPAGDAVLNMGRAIRQAEDKHLKYRMNQIRAALEKILREEN